MPSHTALDESGNVIKSIKIETPSSSGRSIAYSHGIDEDSSLQTNIETQQLYTETHDEDSLHTQGHTDFITVHAAKEHVYAAPSDISIEGDHTQIPQQNAQIQVQIDPSSVHTSGSEGNLEIVRSDENTLTYSNMENVVVRMSNEGLTMNPESVVVHTDSGPVTVVGAAAVEDAVKQAMMVAGALEANQEPGTELEVVLTNTDNVTT